MAGCGWRVRRSSSRALAAYGWLGGPWLLVIPLLLLPDVSAVGYLRDPRVGAFTYNLVHNWAFGLGLFAVGLAAGSTPIEILGTVAIAHTGMDRAVGYGLKLPDLLPGHPPRPHGPATSRYRWWLSLAARQGGAAKGGAEHRSERTQRCVSEERRRQRGDGSSWRAASVIESLEMP